MNNNSTLAIAEEARRMQFIQTVTNQPVRQFVGAIGGLSKRPSQLTRADGFTEVWFWLEHWRGLDDCPNPNGRMVWFRRFFESTDKASKYCKVLSSFLGAPILVTGQIDPQSLSSQFPSNNVGGIAQTVEAVDDAEVKAAIHASENHNPDPNRFEYKHLGKLEYSKSNRAWGCCANWLDSEVEWEIELENREDIYDYTNTLDKLFLDAQKLENVLVAFAVDNFLPMINRIREEEEREHITKEDLIEQLRPHKIMLTPNDLFTFYYSEHDWFGQFWVYIEGSVVDGPQSWGSF